MKTKKGQFAIFLILGAIFVILLIILITSSKITPNSNLGKLNPKPLKTYVDECLYSVGSKAVLHKGYDNLEILEKEINLNILDCILKFPNTEEIIINFPNENEITTKATISYNFETIYLNTQIPITMEKEESKSNLNQFNILIPTTYKILISKDANQQTKINSKIGLFKVNALLEIEQGTTMQTNEMEIIAEDISKKPECEKLNLQGDLIYNILPETELDQKASMYFKYSELISNEDLTRGFLILNFSDNNCHELKQLRTTPDTTRKAETAEIEKTGKIAFCEKAIYMITNFGNPACQQKIQDMNLQENNRFVSALTKEKLKDSPCTFTQTQCGDDECGGTLGYCAENQKCTEDRLCFPGNENFNLAQAQQKYVNIYACAELPLIWKANKECNTAIVLPAWMKGCELTVDGIETDESGRTLDDGRPFYRIYKHPSSFGNHAIVKIMCGNNIYNVEIPEPAKRCSPGGHPWWECEGDPNYYAPEED